MRLSLWLLSAAAFVVIAAKNEDSKLAGQFFNPPDAVHGTRDFSMNPVYILGETQTIKFTTIYPNYEINLWQQILGQDAARVGPSIFSAKNGAVTQFDWPVQLYHFDLSASNVFFLWLSSTTKAADGSELIKVSSHYFNITDRAEAPTSSSTTTPAPITSASTKPAPTTSVTSSSATSSPTTPLANEGPATSPPPAGLSTGVQAGIGVGAALVGLAAVIIALLYYRHSRQKTVYQAPDEPRSRGFTGNYGPYKVPEPPYQVYQHQTFPAELGYESKVHGPVELPVTR